jgi:hypothetical protein
VAGGNFRQVRRKVIHTPKSQSLVQRASLQIQCPADFRLGISVIPFNTVSLGCGTLNSSSKVGLVACFLEAILGVAWSDFSVSFRCRGLGGHLEDYQGVLLAWA